MAVLQYHSVHEVVSICRKMVVKGIIVSIVDIEVQVKIVIINVRQHFTVSEATTIEYCVDFKWPGAVLVEVRLGAI